MSRPVAMLALAFAFAGFGGACGDGDPAGTGDDASVGSDGVDGGDDDSHGDVATVDGTSVGDDGAGASDSGDDGHVFEEGGPGCGFEAAAFCETFDAMVPGSSRAGELDGARFSGSRLLPQLPTFDGPFVVGPATAPACRAGLAGSVSPPSDFLLCDPMPTIATRHVLVVTAAQNYGQNTFRVRQPFDFAGREGVVRFDAELWSPTILYGFVSVAITADPVGVPSFAIDQNYEGGALPREGVSVQFTNSSCLGDEVSVSSMVVYRDHEQEIFHPSPAPCFAVAQGRLNRVDLRVSEGGVTVVASAPSPDGVSFPEPLEVARLDAVLPMTRGYVQLNVHNHATLKYSEGEPMPIDAWTARFDNVAFDGPVVTGDREHEVPDALTPIGAGTAIGYYVPEPGAPPLTLAFSAVDLGGVGRAALSFNHWMLSFDLGDPVFFVRVNGGPVHERPLTASEVAAIVSPVGQGAASLMVELPVAELVPGDNAVELNVGGVSMDYPPAIANVDLHLSP